MAHHYCVTAHKATAVNACATGNQTSSFDLYIFVSINKTHSSYLWLTLLPVFFYKFCVMNDEIDCNNLSTNLVV